MKFSIFISGIIFLLNNSNEWTTYYNDTQIEIQYKKAECPDNTNDIHQEKFLIRYTNKTDKNIQLSFYKKIGYSNGKVSPKNENTYTVTLKPNEIIEGSCNDRDKTLAVFSKHLDRDATHLQSIDFENITIKTIQ